MSETQEDTMAQATYRAAWSQVYGRKSWQAIIQQYEGPGDRWSGALWECRHRHTSREMAKACGERRLVDRVRPDDRQFVGVKPPLHGIYPR